MLALGRLVTPAVLVFSATLSVTACASSQGVGLGSDKTAEGAPAPAHMSATAQCGQATNGFGPFFFCGTNQANLNVGGFQYGSTGYCMFTNQNLSIVWYSVILNNGGTFPVKSQAEASADCALQSKNPFPNNCTTYIQCTLICAAGVSNCTSR